MAADVVKVVDDGLGITTNRIIGAGTEPKYIGCGTGTTAAANTDTALETPRNEARIEGTSSRVTTNTTNDTYQVTGTWTAASTAAALTELALFDGAGTGTPPTGANLFLRGTFDVINLSVGNTLTPSVKTVYNQA